MTESWISANKRFSIIVVILSSIVAGVLGALYLIEDPLGDTKPDFEVSVTQEDLLNMIDEWMNNPEPDDREQRLEIMKAFYTFEESGQQLTNDQEGRAMFNQIRTMISFDIPKDELDQMKEEIKKKLQE